MDCLKITVVREKIPAVIVDLPNSRFTFSCESHASVLIVVTSIPHFLEKFARKKEDESTLSKCNKIVKKMNGNRIGKRANEHSNLGK